MTWHDAGRRRDVPARIYLPRTWRGPAPLVVFSHGLGSSCDGYTYLGRHWATHGYVVAHLTHFGSDATALRGPGGLPPRGLADFLADVSHRRDRPRDVSFALDRIAADAALAPRVDFERVGVAGHSYGAHTALALVGLLFDSVEPPGASLADQRVRLAMVMSPQSQGNFELHAQSWSRIDRPVLALSGTRDVEYGVGTAAGRRTSFDRTPGRDQYLVTIHGATHASFADQPDLRVRVKRLDPAHHEFIRMATTAFLDAYLRDDAAARRWLLDRTLESVSGGACQVEYKNVTPAGEQSRGTGDRP